MAVERKYLSLDKLGLYDEKIKKVISDGDAASLKAAKDYADGLATNYDAAGDAATAESNAKAHAEAQVAAEKQRAEQAEQANATAAAGALTAAQAAQAAADAAQGDVDALETLVGTLPAEATATDVVGYVIERTSGIATDAALSELTGKVTQAEKDIDAIEADYLKAADKTELEGKITAEETRAKAAEEKNAADIKAIADDYLKAADKTELADAIALKAAQADFEALKEDVDAFFADADMTEAAKDTLKELQEYIASDESGASAMAASIKQNADDIDALEGRMDAAETAIGTKAASADLEAAVGRIATLEGASATHATTAALEAAVDALESVDAGFETRIAAVEAKFTGEDSVADLIAAAKQEAIDAAAKDAADKGAVVLSEAQKYADNLNTSMDARVAAVEAASATHAAAADLTALAGRVTTAEGEIDTLQSEMDAVEALAAANKAAHEANAAAIATKAAQADLETAVGRIEANEAAIAAFVEISESEINALFA